MFIAEEVSVQLIEALASIVPMIAREDRDLADQLRRAASGVTLNLAEGSRSKGGSKNISIAHGSANEVRAALKVARAWGWLPAGAQPAFEVLDRLLALLWKLTHQPNEVTSLPRGSESRSQRRRVARCPVFGRRSVIRLSYLASRRL